MYPQVSNPCEEERYIELKKKSLDEMSDREYEYFRQKDKVCSEYILKQIELEKINHQKGYYNSYYDSPDLQIIGGINYSTIDGKDVDNAEYSMGFRIGVEAFSINGFSLLGVTYSQRGFSTSNGDISGEMKINYITCYMLSRFPLNEKLDLLVGTEFGFFTNGKSKSTYCYNGNCETDTEGIDDRDWRDMKGYSGDIGFVFGGRYSINEYISLNGTYFMAFNDLMGDLEANNRSFQIYLSYGLK